MLQFESICAGYEGVERLHQVSARVRPGELIAVIGPNGSGKSTLIRCMAGLLRITAGSIRLDGRDFKTISERVRAQQISYMPQSRPVPDISVYRLAMHGRYPHLKRGRSPDAADREIVCEALRRTDLTAHAERMVSRLSGGERQRAYLAMMLAQQTPVMLMDEPTAYLDLSAQFALMDLLRELCREGRSAVVVLHDLALAMKYADRILLMQDGRLMTAGSPDEIFRSGMIPRVFGVSAERLDEGKYLFSPLG